MRHFFITILTLGLLSCGGTEQSDASAEETETIDSTATSAVDSALIEVEEEETYDIPHFTVTDTSCLPMPDEKFRDWTKGDLYRIFNTHQRFYPYLITHFDSLETKEVLAEDENWGVTEWQQKFSGGFIYHEINEPELGGNYEFITPCKDKTAFLKVFHILAEDVENSWNADSTKYYPQEIGCSYDIMMTEDSTWMASWYCGC